MDGAEDQGMEMAMSAFRFSLSHDGKGNFTATAEPVTPTPKRVKEPHEFIQCSDEECCCCRAILADGEACYGSADDPEHG